MYVHNACIFINVCVCMCALLHLSNAYVYRCIYAYLSVCAMCVYVLSGGF